MKIIDLTTSGKFPEILNFWKIYNLITNNSITTNNLHDKISVLNPGLALGFLGLPPCLNLEVGFY